MDIIELLEDNKWTLAYLLVAFVVSIIIGRYFPNYKSAVMVGWLIMLIIFFVFIGVKYGSGDANLLTNFYNIP
jgi:Flp pilus assembly protein protease CpaA